MEFPPQPPPSDSDLIELLYAREDIPTSVHLRDGRVLEVFDIAWGYDPGEETAHITTNCGPPQPDRPIDLIRSGEVLKVVDPVTETDLWVAES